MYIIMFIKTIALVGTYILWNYWAWFFREILCGDQLVSELESNLMKMFAKIISAMEEDVEREQVQDSCKFLQVEQKSNASIP